MPKKISPWDHRAPLRHAWSVPSAAMRGCREDCIGDVPGRISFALHNRVINPRQSRPERGGGGIDSEGRDLQYCRFAGGAEFHPSAPDRFMIFDISLMDTV